MPTIFCGRNVSIPLLSIPHFERKLVLKLASYCNCSILMLVWAPSKTCNLKALICCTVSFKVQSGNFSRVEITVTSRLKSAFWGLFIWSHITFQPWDLFWEEWDSTQKSTFLQSWLLKECFWHSWHIIPTKSPPQRSHVVLSLAPLLQRRLDGFCRKMSATQDKSLGLFNHLNYSSSCSSDKFIEWQQDL